MSEQAIYIIFESLYIPVHVNGLRKRDSLLTKNANDPPNSAKTRSSQTCARSSTGPATSWRSTGAAAGARRLKYGNIAHVFAFLVHFIEKELDPDCVDVFMAQSASLLFHAP
jgi:hypothetical protein